MDNEFPKPIKNATTSQSSTTGLISEKWIKRIVKIYFCLYLIVTILAVLILLLSLLSGRNLPTGSMVSIVIAAIVGGGFSYGLKTRKPWLPFFIVLLAGLSIINGLVFAEKNIVFVISLLFSAFGIYFFSQRDVRKIFGVKGLYFV